MLRMLRIELNFPESACSRQISNAGRRKRSIETALTHVLQSRRIAIYVHDERDGDLFTDEKRVALRQLENDDTLFYRDGLGESLERKLAKGPLSGVSHNGEKTH